MSETILTLTPAQVLAIYEAGVKRGNDEATSYEWGSHASGGKFDELENAILWDGDFKGVAPDDYEDKKAWWNRYRQELERTP